MPNREGSYVNAHRMWLRLEELAKLGRTPDGGVTRLALSTEDRAAAEMVGNWLEPLGFAHTLDSAGNHFWQYPADSDEPAVMVGSHLDSVPNGGRFDGAAGVVAAAEVAQVLVENGKVPKRPLVVVAFANEEGVRFPGGLMGSQALAGVFEDDSLLRTTDSNGTSLRDALTAFGVKHPSLTAAARPAGSTAAYFELHIEQGSVLEEAGHTTGFVSGITGLYQARVRFGGRSGHAGATPMAGRRDPILGAAHVMQQTESIALASEGSVRGTVGWVEVRPGAENVIPDSVQLSIDLRSLDEVALLSAVASVKAEMRAVSEARGLSCEVATEQYTAPVLLDHELRSHLERVALDSGVLHSTLASGGGHDAMIMQSICPTAMVFVRSKNGLSHCPEEYSSPEDLAAGTELLLRGVAKATHVQLG